MKKNGEYVGVDEKFIPENEKYVDESLLGDKEKQQKIAKRMGKGYLVFVVIIMCFPIIMMAFSGFMIFKMNNKTGKSTINFLFEQYQGTRTGINLRDMLDRVITHNKTNDYIITVVYNDNTATLEDDIVAIKKQIINKDYEVSIGYDEKGIVNKIEIINPVENLYDFDYLSGTKIGSELRAYLDDIIKNNKLGSYVTITVTYNGKVATTVDDLLVIRNEISNKYTKYYEVAVDYTDSHRNVINKVTIKDIK